MTTPKYNIRDQKQKQKQNFSCWKEFSKHNFSTCFLELNFFLIIMIPLWLIEEMAMFVVVVWSIGQLPHQQQQQQQQTNEWRKLTNLTNEKNVWKQKKPVYKFQKTSSFFSLKESF